MSSKGALILVSVDTEAVRSVLRGLDPKKQNAVLKKALKQTSEQARNRLAEKAQGSYTEKNAGFKKAKRIRVSGTSARILSEGAPLSLEKFSNSIPAMIGSEKHVYGMVEPYIAEDLQKNLRRFVDEALGKGNA